MENAKNDDKRRGRFFRLRIFASIALVLVLIGFFLHHRYLKIYYGYDPLPFSQEAWAEATPEERGYMSDDMLEQYSDLEGMSEAEVLELLGPPDFKSVGESWGRPRGSLPDDDHSALENQDPMSLTSAHYELGYLGFNSRTIMVFSYSMAISFDDDGYVSKVVIDD